MKQRCKSVGALGGGISGSGPSLFMLSKDETTAKAVQKEMNDVYEKIGLAYHSYVTTINMEGVKVIK